MLTIYSLSHHEAQVWKTGMPAPGDSFWFDLRDPNDVERKFAESVLGQTLPTREQMSGIELSSRVQIEENLLRLNIPFFVNAEGGKGAPTPLGFALTSKLLVSLRYADSMAFDMLAHHAVGDTCPESSIVAFVKLIETIVDVAVDRIQESSAELSQLAGNVFSERRGHARMMRGALFQIGRMQRRIMQIRATMLGVSRILAATHDAQPHWLPKQQLARLKSVLTDLESMREFDQQLNDKVQFLLDAVLGFINNDQNDVMKVLTIVSVVTIPPMILAGIWGMNFKSIPEYNWEHGYAFGLAMIVLSMIVPLAWLKWKKWL